jgi:hypothetical protein
MKKFFAICTVIALSFGSTPAIAGPYGDDLTKCLISSVTDTDKTDMVKFIFSAMSLNKKISPYINMSNNVRENINKKAGELYTRLITDTCKLQTYNAAKYEGPSAVTDAFKFLGQVSAQSIFSDPSVSDGMKDVMKYFDQEKLNSVLQGK